MLPVTKFVVGMRPALKIFRMNSLSGLIIDKVLAVRSKKGLSPEYYKQIGRSESKNSIVLRNDDLGNLLVLDEENIIFIKSYYDEPEQNLNCEKLIDEFALVWKIIDEILDLQDIRRIGLVVEHQIKTITGNPNKDIIQSFCKIKPPKHPAKFKLRYEERLPTAEGLAPDINKSDFINIIHDYYDSELDENPKEGYLNANFDIQRYFMPLLSSDIFGEVRKLSKFFLKEKNKFESNLKELGLIKNA